MRQVAIVSMVWCVIECFWRNDMNVNMVVANEYAQWLMLGRIVDVFEEYRRCPRSD